MQGGAIIVKRGEIWHRSDFSILCNWRLCFTAVEIGVDRGEFAQEFLKHWRGWNYLGVDDYLPYKEMPWDRRADLEIAVSRFAPYGHTAKLAIANSDFVAQQIYDQNLGWAPRSWKYDFVYIDASHLPGDVKHDMETWWPLVSDHGILAGHDYHPFHEGLIDVIDEFADNVGQHVYITQDDPASWYIYKQGIPGPGWDRNP